MNPQLWSAYAIPLAMVLGLHVHRRRRRETKAVAVLQEAVAAGMTEPPSLHPVVDAAICCGARACVNACPEKALGIVNGKAQLVNPSVCIGHGACAAACPVEAIKLVFGSAAWAWCARLRNRAARPSNRSPGSEVRRVSSTS
jgi:thioredoxin reductase (NADPH)